MNKKSLFSTLVALSIIAAVAMCMIGKSNGHLTELKDFFWVPLPLTLLFLLLASRTK